MSVSTDKMGEGKLSIYIQNHLEYIVGVGL